MASKYEKMIPKIQKSPMEIRLKYAIFAYALMVLGLSMFVIPNVRLKNLYDSVVYGGSFGLILYGIYDYTSAAVLKDWDENLAIIDILWGSFVYTAASYIGSFGE
tara:strand:+ start:345 stop:659 length:315 start_codon:yes stop_codon:yes gene_type:complete